MTLAQEVAVTAAAEGAYLLHGCLAQRLNQGMGSLRGVLLTEQRQEAQVLPGASQGPAPTRTRPRGGCIFAIVQSLCRFQLLRPQGPAVCQAFFSPSPGDGSNSLPLSR